MGPKGRGIREAEHRCVRAYAEGKRHHGGHGELWGATQRSQRELEVLTETVNHC